MTAPAPARRGSSSASPSRRSPALLILSKAGPDQGWKFGEFDEAIADMPEGPERAGQRMYFDALRLLAAFIQHGDRKAEQQRLVCLGQVDTAAGDIHPH